MNASRLYVVSATRDVVLLVVLTLVVASFLPASADALPPPKGCKRLLWFTAFSGNGNSEYMQYIRVATLSARKNAPWLIPHLITDKNLHHLATWYTSMGGTIHRRQLSFKRLLDKAAASGRKAADWLEPYGTFFRFDIPIIMSQMKNKSADCEYDYVLYTDADVMFLKHIDSCSFSKPRFISMGAEFERGTISNAGVMYINVTAFGQDHDALIQWGVSHDWPGAYDQAILLAYYEGRITHLPDEFNWKPYWGVGNVSILHFHGPKPFQCADCLVENRLLLDHSDCQKITECPDIYVDMYRTSPKEYFAGAMLRWFRFYAESLLIHTK